LSGSKSPSNLPQGEAKYAFNQVNKFKCKKPKSPLQACPELVFGRVRGQI